MKEGTARVALVVALALDTAATVGSAAFVGSHTSALFGTVIPPKESICISATTKNGRLWRTPFLESHPEDASEFGSSADNNDGLILNDIDSQMAKLRNKYPTSEADYLAAARARNAARAASLNAEASDQDWSQVAAEVRKRQGGGAVDEDWESSAREAGNADSQILIPVDLETSGDSGGEEDEPKLLLF